MSVDPGYAARKQMKTLRDANPARRKTFYQLRAQKMIDVEMWPLIIHILYYFVFFTCASYRTVLANIQLDIDCDRETERIFSFFSSNLSRLQKMEGAYDYKS